ncbi:FAD-binding oxidoreductase [Chitinophaga sancti]|uniref:FAD-binding oxidoreductase n=1 Tax=Chitinophaga sancti TaxID=1004 RepID=A0A1K1NBJ5_9BACT|nr:FAD-binding oxidoreductase [Chitinophaga sancti]WQD63362.1 FAD-binding oxidoreductase [Chitinophaga sancti]WQG91012.1 FAD-binding oxidoreductase [Chitinophaga sancti]SFW32824.1 FAD/FMN-containing dehydrogenase [Chitinophaga sancti]
MEKRLANWGNYPVISCDETTFTQVDQVEDMISSHSSIIARGNGRCYGDASLATNSVSTLKFDKVLEFDTSTGVFECQSGITLDQILEVVVPKGWFLPVTPGTKFITVGGAVASDVHGKNHHAEGSFSNHIIDMDVITGKKEILTCSKEVLPDLFWATCGGMGLTGIITRVKFGLKKIETAYIKQKQVKARNLDELIRLFEEYNQYTYSMAWIDCLQKGDSFGRGILIVGEHATKEELNTQQAAAPLSLPDKRPLSVPFNFPSFALNTFTVKAFNWLYYAKNTKREINNVIPYEPFFYPLDAILHWNRGYGKAGFVQYQFVLPLDKKEGLVEILKRISDAGLGSFLAVLKVFGHQDDLISFPRQGYTLALDFPVRKGLFAFLDELDEVVLQYGGRLYLSKDARMKKEVFWQSYPNAQRFAEIVKAYNGDKIFHSVQSERLGIN